jgi:tRNA A-37 threonylcarbamoyl transferase component Bud32
VQGPPGVETGLFAGRYSIERAIGRGATATVYLARDAESAQQVAIKVLRPELAQSGASVRFLREIRRTGELRHPHILPVLDSGEHNGQLFFVLPYMEGGTLRDRLAQEKQLPIEDAVAIARTVAEALDHAHRNGLIHRDVKPENILFGEGQAHLSDFGIARALQTAFNTSVTSSGIVRGTPAYMSPEQASGATDYDGRSDVFSLGCVLYEMLAGIPAFIGPSLESVIAQRFSHPPRDLRVYRPTVPVALDTVVMRAVERSPADRYRTAGEFASAMTAALSAPVVSGSRHIGVDRRAARGPWAAIKARYAVLGLLTMGAVALVVTNRIRATNARWDLRGDTTLVAALPLEGVPDSARRLDMELLQDGLARWRGVRLVDPFQIGDALRRLGTPRSPRDAASLVASLGAGRYVRGNVTPLGDARRVSIALYDVGAPRPLYQQSQIVPADLNGAAAAYARLADSLLLRGATADSVPGSAVGGRSLPAAQAFAHAQRDLDAWDLVAADSALQAAMVYDPDYAKASLWLAQVRAWREDLRSTWPMLAERAIALSTQLSERERKLGEALNLLGSGEFAAACNVYDSLRRINNRDFAAWFGLGQCRTLDNAVVADASSPSGWRYRSSRHRAMQAYATAFEILPSVHRGYERGAFERLKVLLLVSTQLKIGYGVSDSAPFLARPGLLNDTLALVPYPWQVVHAGGSDAIPPGFQQALDRRRAEFRKIAAGWSAAFPRAAGAKQAVAISLELMNDPAAIDTIRLARALTTDSARQTQLAVAEVMLLVKFGVPDDLAKLRMAHVLAESLLVRPEQSQAGIELLAPVAALSGRCDRTEQLVRREVPPGGYFGIPSGMLGDANALLARLALGCPMAPSTPAISVQLESIARDFPTGAERRRAEETLLSRSALLDEHVDSAVLARLAASTQNELLLAAQAIAQRDSKTARATLESFERKPQIGAPTPDMALARAHLWDRLGDRQMAIRALDGSLELARTYDTSTLIQTATAAAFMRAITMRADLAAAAQDHATARRWGAVASILWSSADADLQSVQRRMASYSASR